MRRFRRVLVVAAIGLAGSLVGVFPSGASAVAGRAPCRATSFVNNQVHDTVSTIGVKTGRQ
jgi:hypothetical protein